MRLLILCLLLIPSVVFAGPSDGDKTLVSSDLTYLGAFRVPDGEFGCADSTECSFDYSGRGLGYNDNNDSLYMFGHVDNGWLAEISIPTLVNSSTLGSLNTATVLQNFTDVWSGTLGYLGSGGSYVSAGWTGGVLYNGSKLVVSQYIQYDSSHEATLSHATVNSDWSSTLGFSGMKTLSAADARTVGQNAGHMAIIPTSWQSAMGGSALSGQSMISIIGRSSMGPSAWVFDPDDIGVTNPAPAVQVVGYPEPEHTTLGAWDAVNDMIGGGSKINGIVWPDGSKTVLFFGMHGDTWCYGNVPADCTDPVKTTQGNHSYPYHASVWAYDADDLLAVKNGTSDPWDLTPTWRVNIEDDLNGLISGLNLIKGAAYDASNQIIYLSAEEGDSAKPVVHAYSIDVAAGTGGASMGLGANGATFTIGATGSTVTIQ